MKNLFLFLILSLLLAGTASAQNEFKLSAEGGISFSTLSGAATPASSYESDVGYFTSVFGELYYPNGTSLVLGISFEEINFIQKYDSSFFNVEAELPEQITLPYSIKGLSVSMGVASGILYSSLMDISLYTGVSPFVVLSKDEGTYTYQDGNQRTEIDSDLSSYINDYALIANAALKGLIRVNDQSQLIGSVSLGYDLLGIYETDFENGNLLSWKFGVGYQYQF